MPKPVKIAAVALTALWMLCCAAALCRADAPLPKQAMCRVTVDAGMVSTPEGMASANDCGSGTLVDCRGGFGLVITNWHVFRDGGANPGKRCTVTFADGATFDGVLSGADETLDLAAIEIKNPGRAPAVWSDELSGQVYRLVGFGSGQLQSMPGHLRADYGAGGQHSVSFDRPVREGDSGGGVFDEQGTLCGVIWGSTPDEAFAVHPVQVGAFIRRMTGDKMVSGTLVAQTQQTCYVDQFGRRICPNQITGLPTAPAVRSTPVAVAPAAAPPPASCNCKETIAALAARVNELEARQPVQGPPGERGPQGEQGPRGTDGEDGQDAVFDVEAVAAAMRAALPPIHVVQRDYHTGAVVAERDVALGETLTLRFGAKEQPVDVVRPQP